MKKILLPSLILFFIFFTACNNADKKKDASQGILGKETSKTLVDSLEAEVMDGHNASMAKYGKLMAMQNAAQRLLDSIAKLPAKARDALTPLKTKLNGLVEDLGSAKANMDKWMDEYNMDSAVNNAEQRIKYLTSEKIKISKIKETILNGLQQADSVLKAKF